MGITGESDEFELTSSQSPTIQPDSMTCNSILSVETYEIALLFSVCIITLFSFLEKRNNPNICGSRPGLVYPVNLLDDKSDRIGQAAAFGSMASHCWTLINGSGSLNVSPWAKSLFVLVEVLLIGLLYYPLFHCLQTTWVLLGSILGIVFAGYWFELYLASVIKCPTSTDGSLALTYENIAVMLPVLVCLLVLMVKFAVKFVVHVITLIRRRNTSVRLIQEEIQEERLVLQCNIDYVKQLLVPVCNAPMADYGQIKIPSLYHKVRMLLSRCLYQNDSTFKYSPRVVAIFSVGIICSYQFGILLVIGIYHVQKVIPELRNLFPNSTDDTTSGLKTALQVFNNSAIVSLTLSSVLTLLSIYQILTNYRENLKQMFKGDFKHLPFKRGSRYSQLILSDSLAYAGFQIAHILFGYMISFVVLLVTCILVAVLIVLPLLDVLPRNIIKYSSNFLSGYIVLQVILILQKVFCRVLLHRRPTTNDDGTATTTAVLAIDNRKIYHNMSYFLFFFYVVLGIVGCLVTIFKGIVLGVFFLARLDKCGLIQDFETFDLGYMYYVSFLHVEECHRHPVLLVFCDILSQNLKQKHIKLHEYATSGHQHLSEGERLISVNSSIQVRNRWLKAYTLVRNPALKMKEPDQDFDNIGNSHKNNIHP